LERIELYTVLPKATGEAAYCDKEQRWQHDFAAEIADAQRFRKMKPAKTTPIQPGTIFKRSELRR